METLSGRRVQMRAQDAAPARTDAEAWQQLLRARGLAPDSRFFRPRLADLPDPAGLRDALRAAERIADAVVRGEPIHVFGDFDCDGVAGTALLVQALMDLGARVSWSVPDRSADGHGIPTEAVLEAVASGARVGIAVDTGSAAHEAAQAASSSGMDLIVCDHHAVSDLPRVYALVNPARDDCGFADRVLCGTGVAFFVLMAVVRLLREKGHDSAQALDLRPLLPLVALATVADVMPLVGVNRILVARGLVWARHVRPVGVAALAASARRPIGALTSEDLAFYLAPRINAAGRMRDGAEAVRLLLARDPEQAKRLAAKLEADNRRRQKVQAEVARAAARRLGGEGLAVCDPAWHLGVIGLAAGSLARARGVPIAIGSGDPKATVRVSVRAPSGWDVHALLTDCAPTLESYGGHAGAGGGVVRAGMWEAFAERFQAAVRAQRARWQPPAWEVDGRLTGAAITLQLAEQVSLLEPTGHGNPPARWLLVGEPIVARQALARGAMRMRLGAARVEAVAFSASSWEEALVPGAAPRLVGRVERNTWGGVPRVQFVVEDVIPG